MTRTHRSSVTAGALLLGLTVTPLAVAGTAAGAEPAVSAQAETCSPTAGNRPVCAADAPVETAAFLDPTARVTAPDSVQLGHSVYVAPFAVLASARSAPIVIGAESNVQDNVQVFGAVPRQGSARSMAAIGLTPQSGVELGERVILAHGSEVRGPARIGVAASEADGTDDPAGVGGADGAGAVTVAAASSEDEVAEDSGVFLSFGAQVDGAVIERDTALSALSRVGPGVRLRSGMVVLPGKNVTTQAQADDPALGKVRPLIETDVAFNAGVVEVNVGLAREYSRLARQNPSAVRGINVDPGGNEFDDSRDAPTVESALCAGPEVRRPAARNRIIGDVCFEDSLRELDRKTGDSISIRADEGGPFSIGTIKAMDDRVVFHALEGNELFVGARVDYGSRSIVHGGGRPQLDPTTDLAAPTVVGNDVVLGDQSVVFRSLLRNGTSVGYRSAVVGSETALGQVIPDRTIYVEDAVFGPVEW